MKKKILTFLFSILFIVPCMLLLTACEPGGDDGAILNGYDVYINGAKSNEFKCTYGENAITKNNVTIKSNWSNASKNADVPLDNFDITVKWLDQYGAEFTTMPSFWTSETGSTLNDCVTTYEFTLTLSTDNAWTTSFKVVIEPEEVKNLRIKVFDGEEYYYSTEMIWGHNVRETNPEKQSRLEIENLDPNYQGTEHIQWAFIEKDVYDALETNEEKKTLIRNSQNFSTGQIYNNYTPGTYYIFANVPSWNNKVFGEDGDGFVYNYATLTIKPIELVQTENKQRVLQHSDWGEFKEDFRLTHVETVSEITANVDYDYSSIIWTTPYAFVDGQWKALDIYKQIDSDTIKYTSIQVHAIQTADGYKLVDLKDVKTSKTDWVFVNDDGTQGDAVTDNSKIEVIVYKELASYKAGLFIKIPFYYMVDDVTTQGVYIDCSNLYRTEVKIRKYAASIVPHVDVGGGDSNTSKYITGYNTFEFTYGDTCQASWAEVWNTETIMQQALYVSASYYEFDNLNQTEYSEEPHIGYVRLSSPHFAWKLDGVNWTSEPAEIKYYINKAIIDMPTYTSNQETYDEHFNSPINIVWSEDLQDYSINSHINFDGKFVNVYRYKMTNEDLYLTKSALTEKIREHGTLVEDYSTSIAQANENTVGSMFVVLYDLQNTNSTAWDKGTYETTQPRLFKFKIVDGE